MQNHRKLGSKRIPWEIIKVTKRATHIGLIFSGGQDRENYLQEIAQNCKTSQIWSARNEVSPKTKDLGNINNLGTERTY